MNPIPLLFFLFATDVTTAGRLFKQGRFEEAATEYRAVLRENPSSVAALLGMGKTLIELHAYRPALQYLSTAERLAPADREVRRALAHALTEANLFAPAEERLKRLTADDAKDADSWFYLGTLYYKSAYWGAALPALDQALALQPANAKAAIYRAVCLAKLGRAAEAEKSFLQLLQNPANERDPDLLLVYAELLYDTQRPGLALNRVDQALRANADSPMGHFWKAKILFGTEHVQEAANEAQEAIRLAPMLPFPRALLLSIDEALGRTEDAAVQAEWLRTHETAAQGQSR